jgi:hypothetical protein
MGIAEVSENSSEDDSDSDSGSYSNVTSEQVSNRNSLVTSRADFSRKNTQ